jgi:hypothetical protein
VRSIRGPHAVRAERWVDRIATAETPFTVEELYLGEYWQSGQRLLLDASKKFKVVPWVVSAGYGLLGSDDKLSPYGATFATSQADSIPRPWDPVSPSESRRQWWTALTETQWRSSARSITDVVQDRPKDRFLLCIGPSYLDAVRPDLERALALVDPEQQVMVVGSGSPPSGAIGASYVSVPSKLRIHLGGSMNSLCVRAAGHVVRYCKSSPTPTSARRSVKRLADQTAELPVVDRRRMSDAEILRWIGDQRSTDPTVSASRLLTRFRAAGFACEQSRFGELFHRKAWTS